MDTAFFYLFALLVLGGAIMTITRRSAIHSAIWLIVSLIGVAGLYLLQKAEFLFAVQIILYIGGIMVLFLFVIMLLGVDRKDNLRETIRFQVPLTYLFVAGLLGLLIYTVRAAFDRSTFQGLQQANAAGNTQGLGRLLFTHYLFPFEVTSLLLIVAAIGAMVIGKRRAPSETEPEDEDA